MLMSMPNSSAKEPLPPLDSARHSLLGKAYAVRQFPSCRGRKKEEAIQKHNAGSEKDVKNEWPKATDLPNVQHRGVPSLPSNNRPAVTYLPNTRRRETTPFSNSHHPRDFHHRRASFSHRTAFKKSHRARFSASPGNHSPRTTRFPNNHHSIATEFVNGHRSRTAAFQNIHSPRAFAFSNSYRAGPFDFSDSYHHPRATTFPRRHCPRAIVFPNSLHRSDIVFPNNQCHSQCAKGMITSRDYQRGESAITKIKHISKEKGGHKIEKLPTRQGEEERGVKKNHELIKSKFVCSHLFSFGEDARRIADKCQPSHQVKNGVVTIQTIDPPAVILNDGCQILNDGCQPSAEAIIPKFPDEKIMEETKENLEVPKLSNSSAHEHSPSSEAIEAIIEIDSTRDEESTEEFKFQEDVKFSPEEQDVEVMVVDSSSEEVKVPEAQFQIVTYMEVEADKTEDVEVIGVDSSNEVKVQEAQFQDVISLKRDAESCPFQKEIEEATRVIMEKHKAIDVSSSEPESKQTIGKTRRKRKENNFEIVPLKRGKHDFLVHNSDLEIVPIDSKPRQRVMETLSTFRSIYDMTLQQDSLMQANQLAYKLFKERNGGRNGIERFMGTVPGVEIGDEFRLRVEMFIIGLHCQHLAGIDYIKDHGKEIAVSIVSSGRYSNNRRNSDVLLYSGTGVVHEDQELKRGNLALKNSIDAKIPVRVIHGIHKYQGNKRSKTYVYDGLYLAEKYWFRKGEEGHCVIMFRLRRMPGQMEISIDGIQWSSARRSSAHGAIDISNGEEDMPIHPVNTVDGDLPMRFKYVSKIILPQSYTPAPPTGCCCTEGCSDTKKCSCAVKNSGKLRFNDSGEIMKARPLVYECGPCCKCPPSCRNRVSQHGIKIPLEIFKTQSRGWGVRSHTLISSGRFICEYAGEVLIDEEAQKRANDEYLFAIGNNYREMSCGRAIPIPSLGDGDLPKASFAVDASEFGNVGRFVNHSCSPNLFAQNVLYDHDDMRMPHIMLFASVDIQPFTELTYDYNYNVDQVYDCNGNVKKKECHCGSQECTGLLY